MLADTALNFRKLLINYASLNKFNPNNLNIYMLEKNQFFLIFIKTFRIDLI